MPDWYSGGAKAAPPGSSRRSARRRRARPPRALPPAARAPARRGAPALAAGQRPAAAAPARGERRAAGRLIRHRRTAMAVLGIDWYRRGWVAVVLADGEPPSALVDPDLDAIVGRFPDATSIAIDMPIGLPETEREADRRARAFVGPRWPSVFATRGARPGCGLVRGRQRARSPDHRQEDLAQQAWALRRNIARVAAAADGDSRIIEVHPEVSCPRAPSAPPCRTRSRHGTARRCAARRWRTWASACPRTSGGGRGPIRRRPRRRRRGVECAALLRRSRGLAPGGRSPRTARRHLVLTSGAGQAPSGKRRRGASASSPRHPDRGVPRRAPSSRGPPVTAAPRAGQGRPATSSSARGTRSSRVAALGDGGRRSARATRQCRRSPRPTSSKRCRVGLDVDDRLNRTRPRAAPARRGCAA